MFSKRFKSNLGNTREDQTRRRILTLMVFVFLLFTVIVFRLFQLQIFRHDAYSQVAENQHIGKVELPAKRGDIYVKDTHSEELSKLATNTTLDLVYVDPNVEIPERDDINPEENKKAIASKLTPLLFPQSEYEACKEQPKDCFYDITVGNVLSQENEDEDELTAEEEQENEDEAEEEYEFKDYQAVLDEISAKTLQDISKQKIDFVILKRDASDQLIQKMETSPMEGIFVDKENFMIYADPTLIPKDSLNVTAEKLAADLNESAADLEKKLSLRDLRYVALKNKLSPATSAEIEALVKKYDLRGVVLIPEHWRFYPEGQLASNILGYIDRANSGQYGIEGYFNVELEGKKGSIISESDPNGRQITVGETKITKAVDGENIVLTIDRIVQKEVEKILEEGVKEFQADSGQIIVMDPFTGAIISMANYPTFDPNDYAAALKLRKYDPEDDAENFKRMEIFKKDKRGKYIPIDKEKGDLENEDIEKYVYENRLGLGALKNKTVSEQYEPGSTFKPLVMAIGLDLGEVRPETTFYNTNSHKAGDHTIFNAFNYRVGSTTMTQTLRDSLNTGMAFVSEKLGDKVMYTYLKKFGFGEYTNIGLEGEEKAALEYYTKWDPSELVTRSYGQGITVTPLQLISAWSALANGGKLMHPYIVDSVIKEGETIKTEPQVIDRVISEETSTVITSMLISVVDSYKKFGGIPGYQIAGKTGTAQIAGGGGYEKGLGSTITSFVGYAPALEPKFVVLVKLDRPRSFGEENTWGEVTAGPMFKKVAEFLFDYYNIPAEN